MKEATNINEKEIDILALINKLWQRKKFIFKVIGIGLIVGLIIAFSIPKEYTASVILTPDAQSASSNSIGSLAALAGISMNNTNDKDALASPNLYPTIINSTPFLKGLLSIQFSNANTEMSLYTYIQKHQKRAWWKYITGLPTKLSRSLSSDTIDQIKIKKTSNEPNSYISKSEMMVMDALAGRLSADYDKKTGITTVEVTMQDPEIASFLADTLTSYLQSYIIKYRTQKARMDLLYAEQLYNESKESYYKAQTALATFIDGNMNVVSATYRTTQEKLQNEATLTYSIYNQTAQQLQMAKIKVQNTTPVFTIIQPAVQPLVPSKPQKKIIVIAFAFLSFIGASLWIIKNDIKAILFENK